MAKQRNQKLKLVCLIDILEKYTDEEHGLTMPEIIEKLDAYDISAERKSIYEDFELLRSFGYDIGSFHQNGYRYNLQSRDFDIAELKMLVDAVQSSKFITPKKTRMLVEKISHLASNYQANELQRNIRVANQIKAKTKKYFTPLTLFTTPLTQTERLLSITLNGHPEAEKSQNTAVNSTTQARGRLSGTTNTTTWRLMKKRAVLLSIFAWTRCRMFLPQKRNGKVTDCFGKTLNPRITHANSSECITGMRNASLCVAMTALPALFMTGLAKVLRLPLPKTDISMFPLR